MSVLSFPASPASGALYVSPNGITYFYSNGSWNTDGASLSPNPTQQNPFRYRTIYTRGYTHCGYQGGSPWRNTNRTLHVTDTTTNLGDMMDNNASYIDGGFSDYNTYVFNNSGSVGGNSATVSSMSMVTETLRTYSSTRNLKTSRTNCKALMSPGLTSIYITGGSSATTDKFDTVTDTMLYAGNAPSGANGGGTGGGLSGFFGEFKGLVGANGTSGLFDWATESWTSGSWSSSASFNNAGVTDGQPKGLSTKLGHAYNANGSYGGSATYYKFNDTTGAYLSAPSRPFKAGEENCQIGQDWGYILGMYNDIGDGQNNRSHKTSYLTDASVELGAAGQPKGHGGMSSGSCATGSVTLLGGTMGTMI